MARQRDTNRQIPLPVREDARHGLATTPRLAVIAGENETEYSIKEVLTLLQRDFPEVTISKIRFLESQGLIAPERTAAGYRRFYKSDIDRLATILGIQKSTFMPLKKIKDHLDGASRQEILFAESPTEPPASEGPAPEARSRRPQFHDAEEAAEIAGTTPELLREMIAHGLVHGISVAGRLHFTPHEVETMKAAQRFCVLGIEPRHLRLYRTAAEREAGFLEQVIAPLLRQRSPESRANALARLEEMKAAGAQLRALLLEGAIANLTEVTAPPR